MHHLPPPPSWEQPSASPSQISWHEQPQIVASAQEITQPFWLSQGIAVYANRRWVRRRTIGIVAAFIVELLYFPLLFVLNFFTYGSLIEPGDTVPLLLTLILMSELAWSFCTFLPFARKPLLLINGEGITVGKLPMLSGAFLSWAEIEAIYGYTSSPARSPTYLCIRPKNSKQFLSRFPSPERWYRYLIWKCGAPVVIDERLLETSVQALLQQVTSSYTGELHTHHIQLWPGTRWPTWPNW